MKRFLRRVEQSVRRRVRARLPRRADADRDTQLVRHVMNEHILRKLEPLAPSSSALEVTGRYLQHLPWKSFDAVFYPEFDLLDPPAELPTYDVVICEQVLEHVADPALALRTLRRLTAPDGLLVVSTPFLVKPHYFPHDYWRFTPEGLQLLLTNAGFEIEELRSWGNRFAVLANLGNRWVEWRPWYPKKNRIFNPVVVWAYARPVVSHADDYEQHRSFAGDLPVDAGDA